MIVTTEFTENTEESIPRRDSLPCSDFFSAPSPELFPELFPELCPELCPELFSVSSVSSVVQLLCLTRIYGATPLSNTHLWCNSPV